MRKQGISLIQNTYSGFYTEYTTKDIGKNKLISAQLAVTTKMSIKVPKISRYVISTQDINSNKLYEINKNS